MKRILGLLMAFMLCLGAFTLVGGVNTVKAAEGDIASGTSGTCNWVIDKNGILTISAADGDVGYIESDDFTLTSWPWYSYNSYVKKVIIEDRIVLGKSMYGMFCSMKSCTSIDGLSNLDTSNVVDMSSVFSQDSKLVSLDLTGWNTDKVTKISSMFNGCTNLKTLELGNFNALNLIYGYGTFFNCHALEKLDLSNFDISKCYDKNMFANIYNLHTVVLSEKTNLKKFGQNAPSSGSQYTGKWVRLGEETGESYTLSYLFNNAASKAGTWVAEVKELPYAVFDETTGTLSFVRAKEVHGNNSTGTVTSISGGEYTGRVFTVDETGNTLTQPTWTSIQSQVKKVVFVDEIKPKNLYRWFFKCSECTEFNLDKLNTENTVRMRQMFAGCTKIENLDGVKDFKTSNVEDMQAVFAGCSHLTSLDLSMWDTSRVTNMGGLFAYCSRITDLSSIEKWNVSSLMVAQGDVGYTNFSSGMFAETKVSSLNLSNWIPQQSCDMRGMFASMYDLESLNISGFVMTDNTNTDYMFNGSRNLKKLVLGEGAKFPKDYSLTTPLSAQYTGKWIREDKAYGPYTPVELRKNYTPEMAGTWVWELAPIEYTISFAAGENGTGAMQSVSAPAKEDFTLPENQFVAFGYEFDHWEDGNGKTYADKGTIPANTYAADTKITLTAVWKKRDTSLNWDGNEAEFSIRGGEQAVLDGIPAGTSYQVYELTPDGWVLVQQENASGVIEALEESAAAFWNKYQPGVTTVQFSGLKNLDGRPAEAGKFTFELLENNEVIDTATTQDGGFIQFKVIEYDAAGNHVYTIREMDSNDDAIDYDTHEETVEVSVTDNGDGTLSSEVTYDDDGIVFSNTTRPGTLRITKDATNGTSQNANDEFTIEIEFRNESGMPINDNIYWYVEGGATTPSEISGGNQE